MEGNVGEVRPATDDSRTEQDPRPFVVDIGDVRNLVCQKHEWALAADPAVNSVAFPLAVFQEMAADPRAIEYCHAGTPEEDITALGPFAQQHAPVCEWISTEACERAWAEARKLGRGASA